MTAAVVGGEPFAVQATRPRVLETVWSGGLRPAIMAASGLLHERSATEG